VQNSNWHKKEIDAVFARWRKTVEVGGDYVEK
jgi:hypothetical protein